MADHPPTADVRAELDRILASDIFTRSERLSAYLRFIVERTLAGEGDTLKEQVLAIGLYGKTADFNTAADPIVRVDARRLRDRLREYYASAPPGDLVISVPKGSYTPAFTTLRHSEAFRSRRGVGSTTPPTKSWTVPAHRITTIALAAACVAGVVLYRSSRKPTALLANVVIDLPAGWSILNQPPAISPDSRHIAFSAVNSDGQRAIWLRSLDEGAARLLANTTHGVEPFWSPDGSAIGFFAEGKLKVLDVAGGTARNLCDAPNDSSGTWSASGLMLFAPGQDGTVSAVRAGDGAVRPVTRLDQAAGDLRHSRPQWLQDGRHFVYLADRRDGQIAILASIDGPSTQPLGPVQSHVQPTQTQHVLYVRDGNLLAQRLDVQAGRLTGETTILAEASQYRAVVRRAVLGQRRFARLPEVGIHRHHRADAVRPLGQVTPDAWGAGTVFRPEHVPGWHACRRITWRPAAARPLDPRSHQRRTRATDARSRRRRGAEMVDGWQVDPL